MEIIISIFAIIFLAFLVTGKISFPGKIIRYLPLIFFIPYLIISGFSDDCCGGCGCSCNSIEKKYKIKITSPTPPTGINVNDCMNFVANPFIDWQQIYSNHWIVKIEINPSGTQPKKCYLICNNGIGTFNGNVVDCNNGGVLNSYTFDISGTNNEFLEFDATCNAKFTLKVYIKTNCSICDISSSSRRRYYWMYQQDVDFCKDNTTLIEFSKPWEQKFEDCWSDCQW